VSFPQGGGDMRARIATHDWANSPLGPLSGWPQSLKTLVELMLASAQPMFLAWGRERTWVYNDAFTPILGLKHPTALGSPAMEVWDEANTRLEPMFARVFSGESVYMEDLPLMLNRHGQLEEAHFAFSYTPVPDEHGVVAGLFGTCIETTGRVLAERETAAQREQFAALFEQAPAFMAMLRGPDHRFEFANPSYLKLIGHRPVLGRTVAEALPDAVAQGYLELLDGVFASGDAHVANGAKYRMQPSPDAPVSERYVDFVYQPIRDAAGQVTGIFVEGFDVTDRKGAEIALHELNATLERRVKEDAARLLATERMIQTFFDHSSECYAVLVEAGGGTFRYEEINPATLHLYGTTRDNVLGLTTEEVVGPERAAELNMHMSACLRGGVPYRYERRQGDGIVEALATPVPEEAGGPRRVIVSARDVTERRKLEEQLRQAQKMEAVGQLTGGVAHDFNNLLTLVLGGLDLIGRQLPQMPPSDALLKIGRAREMALQGVQRAAALTSRLLAFSRQQALSPRILDANKLVSGICDLLRRTIGESISLETVLAGGLWPTFADPNQLESALLNLALNARDAMGSGGRLTIETANAALDQVYVRSLSEPVEPGQYVLIAVTDTGIGMDRATLERAFDPFFTTKDVGKGTGLGLSQVYGFARQSSGHIKIYSEVGEGTTVKIYLPRQIGGSVDAEDEAEQNGTNAIGTESILLAEDDDALRTYTSEILRELGYRVLEANNGETALRILAADAAISLLLTDVVMPGGFNGRQLADEAKRRRPDIKVLFMTGYTRNAIVHHGRLDAGLHMIGKPFSFAELAACVRARLDLPE